MSKYGRFPVRSAEEAAELISHGATLGIGGFTDPGCPHAVPTALAQCARGFHKRGEAFRVRIVSGAEAGPARSTWTFRKQTITILLNHPL